MVLGANIAGLWRRGFGGVALVVYLKTGFAALTAVLPGLLMVCCDSSADTSCRTDKDCSGQQLCINSECQAPSGPVPCNNDNECGVGRVCGGAGFCEDQQETIYCTVTANCPIDYYCNTGMAGGVCVLLPMDSCRSNSQCASNDVCSAPEGGVGRCVECVNGSDCASGVCLADGYCVQDRGDAATNSDGGQADARMVQGDASNPGRDASRTDRGGSNVDPYCGAEMQRCCTTASQQETECDLPELTCLYGFPGANDAHCWRGCEPVYCTTLEGETGVCRLAANMQGMCMGTMASQCLSTYQCIDAFGAGACVGLNEFVAFCFDLGCNYQANCGIGYLCSAVDGNLCLATSMM